MTDPVAALAARLAALRPADGLEATHRDEVLALLRATEDPFSADRFDPGHVTGSVLVVAPERHLVLLVLHVALQRWLQPGGHMEPGETDPRVTASREALEETGLAVAVEPDVFDVDVHLIPARGVAPAHRHFDVRFIGIVPGLPAPVATGVAEARWLGREQAEALDLDLGVRRMLAKAAARGLL